MAAPKPGRKPAPNSPNSLFGGLGSLADGAQSIANDFFEFKLAEKELEAQRRGTPSPIGTTRQVPAGDGNRTGQFGATGGSLAGALVPSTTQEFLTLGAIVSGIVGLFVVLN